MLSEFFKQSFPMIEEAKKAKRKPNIFMLIIFCILIYLVCSLIGSFFLFIYVALVAASSGLPDSTLLSEDFNMLSLLSADEINIVSLMITAAVIVGFLLFCRYYEKRYFTSMGFTRKHALSQYLIGLGIGAILMVAVVAILAITCSLTFTSMSMSVLPVVLLTFVAYMIQGASEEIMLRGFLMTSIAARTNKVIIGVIVNTVIFALLHLGNPNIGPISFINLLLFGTFMSLYVLKTKNLWGACALHTMWNFTQGVVFGISVSGNDVASSIFHFTANKDLWFLNGGGFGAEGGLIVTVILGAALAGLVWWIQKDTKQAITE